MTQIQKVKKIKNGKGSKHLKKQHQISEKKFVKIEKQNHKFEGKNHGYEQSSRHGKFIIWKKFTK